MEETQKKIIFIMGAGRSGTTILDIALGNADGVFSCGELNRYPVRKGIPTGFHKMPDRGIFWKRFTEDFQKHHNLEEMTSLHDEFEYHSGLFKRFLGFKRKQKYADYQQYLAEFHQKLFDSIDEDIIVDSSKYPGRALAIAEGLPYEMGFIFIKRHPVGVVNSFAKKNIYLPPKNWLAANVYYFMVNVLCHITARKLRKKHKVVSLKYEDLIKMPEQILAEIQRELKVDLTESIRRIENDEYLEVGELFEGNSIRINERVKFRREDIIYPRNLKNGVTRALNFLIYN